MSSEIVKYQWQDVSLELTKDDVRNLISTSKDVTDKEVMLFLQLCKYQKLNPFVREAYLIKYSKDYSASMVVGKEVFTKRAEDNPNFDGYDITDNWKAGMPLDEFEVTCKVYRKNLTHPITVTVSYPEYVGTDSAGKINRMWKGKPRTMLRKVSLMQGLREAFPTALGGLYEEIELDQQTIPKDITPKETICPDCIVKPLKPITEKEIVKEKPESKSVLKKHIETAEPKLEKKAELNPASLEEVTALLKEVDIINWNQALYYAKKANLKVTTATELKKLLTEDRDQINRIIDARGVKEGTIEKHFQKLNEDDPNEALA